MRLRILPVLIVMAVLTLGIRLGEIWEDFGGIAEARIDAADVSGMDQDPFKAVRTAQAGAAQQAQAEPPGASDDAGGPEDLAPKTAGSPDGTGQAAEGARMAARTPATEVFPDSPFSMTEAEIELLQQLAERREELNQRAEALDRREALLKAAETRLKQDVARLEALKADIEALLIQYDDQEDKQIARLVNIYEKMKPDDAAEIFEDLEMEVLLKVVGRMNERRTAPILAEMQAQKAQALTLELAKRRDLPVPSQ